jgi:outer membrane protein OmpA-like peptidoglycan-associated protein
MLKKFPALFLALLIGSTGVLAQDSQMSTNAQIRTVASGQKLKLKGVVVAKDNDRIVVRDATGVDTNVMLSSATSIKTKGGFFGGGDTVATNQIVRGLNLEIEGRGDTSGGLSAQKVRFTKDNLAVAQSIESRVAPAEDRLTQTEQNAQRISGQIDELMAVSNAARGGAKAAQDTADAAIQGVNATNQRISSVDEYVVQTTATVNFKVGSALLSPEGKTNLDNIAQTALTMKGYLIEVTGFASSDGDAKKNKELSRKRAENVIDYLVETHNIPLRRIGTSFGFGENQAVADNATREGREQNRRVEVKLTVSKGLNQNVEVRKADGQ